MEGYHSSPEQNPGQSPEQDPDQVRVQLEMLEFSKEVGDALAALIPVYGQLYNDAAIVASSPPSPSSESDLIEIRTIAGDMVDSLAILSRTADLLSDEYIEAGIGAQHHPQMVRPLMLDMIENCALLNRVESLGDLAQLVLLQPSELNERISKPQISQWLQINQHPSDQQIWNADIEEMYKAQQAEAAQAGRPFVDNGFAPQEESTPAEFPAPSPGQIPVSPYPQLEPDETPAPAQPVDPVHPPAPVQPQSPNDPWSMPERPGPLPGDRSR